MRRVIRSRPSLLALALGVTVTAMAGSVAAGASTAGATTTSVLAAAKKAVAKEHGVHLEVTSTSKSSTSTTSSSVTADLGTNEGVENIKSGTATATIRVTPTYGYLSGNSAGLTSIIGLTSAQAKSLGTKWMSIKEGTTQYTSLKEGATVPAVDAIFPATKGTTLSMSTASGTSLYVLKWTTAATSSTPKLANTFTLTAKGSTLPVEVVATDSTGSGTTKFSKWNEQVSVNAPPTSSTIDYTKIVG